MVRNGVGSELSKRRRPTTYATGPSAASGEPGAGPVAFMHRPSALNNSMSPIAHHWQDSTHISFGVVTAGIFNKWVKLEGSLFHGREPDEDSVGLRPRGARLLVGAGVRQSDAADERAGLGRPSSQPRGPAARRGPGARDRLRDVGRAAVERGQPGADRHLGPQRHPRLEHRQHQRRGAGRPRWQERAVRAGRAGEQARP